LANRVVVSSARPARVKEVIDITLPQVRSLDVKLQPEFVALERKIWRLIEEEAQFTGMVTA
jgi:NitT/TauT family transport system ATP-binding protein